MHQNNRQHTSRKKKLKILFLVTYLSLPHIEMEINAEKETERVKKTAIVKESERVNE